MTDTTPTTTSLTPAQQAAHPDPDLRVERTGTRRYVGLSSRGARVEIGSAGVDGVFTPGELLKIALGACTAMASDFTISRRLGDDYAATVRVSGDADREDERYPRLEETYELDLSALDPKMADRVIDMIRRSVDAACTVGRTLTAGTEIELRFDTSAGADAGGNAG
ncbi:OsmC family protein [Dietzia sp. ANT_WB102]|uniref:OsmC family protein n=1 Tax=Dietzia sp. ANT_WB102 TaxID=2597345 RepID=UPI0011EE63D8|nr:OsmC family protein [Dietzia sp. ANT_WB102]KAA0919521.1 OsmC family protein [Dietzia sp. ANT_WB102]